MIVIVIAIVRASEKEREIVNICRRAGGLGVLSATYTFARKKPLKTIHTP